MSIKNVVQYLLLRGGYLSQLYPLYQNKFLSSRLSITMYHSVVDKRLAISDWCFLDAEKFRNQLVYLSKNFDIVSLREAASLLRSSKYERPTAVVTFDDGYQNNFDIAFPVLQELQIPATIFLTTGLIDSDETVWFCRINKALTETVTEELFWRGETYDLSNAMAKAQSSARLQAKLKELDHSLLCDELEEICQSLGVTSNSPISRHSPYRMLDRKSIKRMNSSGLIDFGAHTVHHTILSKLPSEVAVNEIRNSINTVKDLTGKPCTLFSYPNGRYQDFDENCVSTLKECGVTAAVTTDSGSNDYNTPLLKLKRYGIGDDATIEGFSFAVHGLLECFRHQKARFL